MKNKPNWNNLTEKERTEFMFLQTSRCYPQHSKYDPRLCNICHREWRALQDKLYGWDTIRL